MAGLASGLLERDASSLWLPHALGTSPESAGMPCVPQVGLAGPASLTFPVVASGEPVSVPDNLLKICKAKPVIFKGKCNAGGLTDGPRGGQHPGVIPARLQGCPEQTPKPSPRQRKNQADVSGQRARATELVTDSQHEPP